jgi:hypothetical protein
LTDVSGSPAGARYCRGNGFRPGAAEVMGSASGTHCLELASAEPVASDPVSSGPAWSPPASA